jgi:hypothetical protein
MSKISTYIFLMLYFIGCCLTTNAQWNSNAAINTPIAVALGEQRSPAICTDGAGGVIIAWYDDRDENNFYDVYVQRLDPNGVALWPISGTPKTGISLASAGFVSNLISPTIDIVSDGNGGAVIVAVGGNTLVNRDIRAQRVDANGTKLWTSNGGFPIVVCVNNQSQNNPKVARMSDGNFVVVWQDDRFGPSGVTDIFAQRLSAATGDKLWSDDGVMVNGAANEQYNPLLVAGNNGDAIIAWTDLRAGSLNPRIYAQKMKPDSLRAWKIPGVDSSGRPVATSTPRKFGLRMCTDGTGGAVMTWYDFNSITTTQTALAQRIEGSDNGNFLWTVDGVPVCNAATRQLPESIALSGNGVVISFTQEVSGTITDLFVQKLDLINGAPLWTAAGVTVCNANNGQNNSLIAGDGAGGAILVWEDYRVTGVNLYAERMNSSGTTVWPTSNGTPVATASSSQQTAAMLTDGCKSFYAWVDSRNISTSGDIYATSLDCNGTVPIISSVTNVSSDIYIKISPNPVRHQLLIQNKGNNNTIAVTITDVSGRIILAGKQFQQNFNYDMSALPQGMYIILAEDKKRNIRLHQMIVKH